jgi:hypothetical protein
MAAKDKHSSLFFQRINVNLKKLYDIANGSSALTEQSTCDSKSDSSNPAAAGNAIAGKKFYKICTSFLFLFFSLICSTRLFMMYSEKS